MSSKYYCLSILLLTIFSFYCSMSIIFAYGGESEALLALNQAEKSIGDTYLTLLETQEAGGEISDFINDFNSALEYQSNARKFFNTGEYDKAYSISKYAYDISKNIMSAAIELQKTAQFRKSIEMRNLIINYLLYIVIIVIIGFLGWSQCKSIHFRRLMELKPEIISDESR